MMIARIEYMCYTLFVQELSRWVTGTEELFYKIPRQGFPRLQTCPACRDSRSTPAKMSGMHVFSECTTVESARSRLGIRNFITAYEAIEHGDVSTLAAFVNGHNEYGASLSVSDYKDRGAALINLRDVWWSTWGTEREGKSGKYLTGGPENYVHEIALGWLKEFI